MKKSISSFFILVFFLLPGFGFLQAQDSGTNSSSQESETSYKLVKLPAGQMAPQNTAVAGGNLTIRQESEYYVKPSQNRSPVIPDVLLLYADDGASIIQSLLIAYGDLGAVDHYEAGSSTPSLAQLQAYDVVVTWTNYPYNNPVAIGNVLADYVDAGGKVINMTFSIGIHYYAMQGRFMDQGYTAMNGSYYDYGTHCLGTFNASHPIMNGITNVCDFYRTVDTYLTPGSSTIASSNSGELFVAVKDNQTVVTINGYVGNYYQWTGQMPDVLHNSILWLHSPPPPPPVPLSNWALYLGIFLIVMFTAIRFRRMV